MTDILECETDELYDGCETVYEDVYKRQAWSPIMKDLQNLDLTD